LNLKKKTFEKPTQIMKFFLDIHGELEKERIDQNM